MQLLTLKLVVLIQWVVKLLAQPCPMRTSDFVPSLPDQLIKGPLLDLQMYLALSPRMGLLLHLEQKELDLDLGQMNQQTHWHQPRKLVMTQALQLAEEQVHKLLIQGKLVLLSLDQQSKQLDQLVQMRLMLVSQPRLLGMEQALPLVRFNQLLIIILDIIPLELPFPLRWFLCFWLSNLGRCWTRQRVNRR